MVEQRIKNEIKNILKRNQKDLNDQDLVLNREDLKGLFLNPDQREVKEVKEDK